MDDLPRDFVNAVCQYIEHTSGFIHLSYFRFPFFWNAVPVAFSLDFLSENREACISLKVSAA